MNEDKVMQIIINLKKFNSDLMDLNIKYAEEIERLTELCNKYEEEHKTTFETWQKDIKEIERLKIQVSARETEYEKLHSIIKEVREYIEEMNVWCVEFENFGVESKGLFDILDKVGGE